MTGLLRLSDSQRREKKDSFSKYMTKICNRIIINNMLPFQVGCPVNWYIKVDNQQAAKRLKELRAKFAK
jgi:hypothetical protein